MHSQSFLKIRFHSLKETYKKWYSPTLGKETEMLIYGHYGMPVILFPCTIGRYFESRDFSLIDAVKPLVDSGRVKVYCVDSIDRHSWYNKQVHPADRVRNHIWFDKFIADEVVGSIRHSYGIQKVAVAGVSFGGYHAANFAFRHPDMVSHLFSMSGAFDIRSFLNGHYDNNVYFNNPVDYLPDLSYADLWQMKIVLGYGEWDICKEANLELSGILNRKGIAHWADESRWAKHDWPLWKMQFPRYLAQL